MTTIADHSEGLVHPALFYESDEDYLAGVVSFLREGLEADEPALVAVPKPKLELIKTDLKGSAGNVAFIDMLELGRNPSRIIPAVRRFTDTHPGGRTRFVGEPMWPGRSPAEIREATRHEALLNLAFDDTPTTILCPYDAAGLDNDVLADAQRTHPHLLYGATPRPSEHYIGHALAAQTHLPPRPPGAQRLTFDRDNLSAMRRFVAEHATSFGLGADRAQDLILAATEVATNTIMHATPAGTLDIWHAHDTGAVICELTDTGQIPDPLAGRHVPSPQGGGGRGLWLVNQLCDLVELHTGPTGTIIRLHAQLCSS